MNSNSANKGKTNTILFFILALSGIVLVLSVLIYLQMRGGSKAGWDYSQQQDLAAELLDSKLYVQAIGEYERLLELESLDRRRQANVNYIIGNIYLIHLRDYENAAARFIQAKLLNLDGELKDKINKGLVICFERLGRSLEAQKQLERSTDLTPTATKKTGGVVVARIGDREITMTELEEQIEMLPPSMQTQFAGREGKLNFLQSYIGSELLYHMALRKGLDKDKEIQLGISQFTKQIMINKALSEEIPQDFEITESEIKLYYDAHKEEFKDKSPEEVKPQIESELKKMKRQEAQNRLIGKLTEAEKVKIYSDQF